MANRSWRNELNNRNYMYGSTYGAPITYNQPMYDDRRSYPNRGGYQEDMKRGKRTYDNIGASPNKNARENIPSTYRRGYNAPAILTHQAPVLTASTAVVKKPIVKYSVKPPRVTFDVKEGSISVLRSRYPKLYVPSDFFHSDFRWQDVFPLYTPLTFRNETKFQMFHQDVEPLTPFDNSRLNPTDANYTYSAKVMLLESNDMLSLVKSASEASGAEKKNIYKSLNFLVGSKAKNEPLAIGGAWSPSLDGLNPDEDPQVLINTAIRTCKELTSIDLTPCKEWYRFVEFHYYRPSDRQGLDISNDNDENRTENENNFRVETVVIFVPSIWDCMPDEDSWEDIKTSYSMALESILSPPLPEPTVEIMESEEKKDESSEKTTDIENKTINGDETNEETKEETDEKVINSLVEIKAIEAVSEVKELTEKDKKRLEHLYKMNESSSIVVHPNKAAKNGKFNCQFMSLGALLEYRTDDQKEHTFEISMFAEQFQEMLQRDAAFTIYKCLLNMPKQSDLDKNENEPDAKRRKEDVDLTNKVPKIDSDIFLAFCVFDIDHAGYIKDHDLEDIIQSIGLSLSRSQVRILISKAINRKGAVYYHELVLDSDVEASVSNDMELSRGNKTKICSTNEQHTIYLGSDNATKCEINRVEVQIKAIIADFNKIKSELECSRKIYHSSKDLENSLRAQLKDLDAQLSLERKNVREVTQTQDVYNGLLRMARDVLDRARSKIDRQFEKEAEKDKPKELDVANIDE